MPLVGGAIVALVCLLFVRWPYKKSVPGGRDVISVEFSADGKRLLSGTRDGEAYLWNLGADQIPASNHKLNALGKEIPTPFNALALAPKSEFVLVAGTKLLVINLDSAKTVPNIWTPECAFGGPAVSPDGSRISAISSEERLLVWEWNDSSKPRDLGRADAGVYGATAFSPDGKRIASAGHTLQMVDAQSGRVLWVRPRDNYVFLSVAFRADGRTIATGSQDTSIRLWDAETGTEIAILRGHHAYVDAVAFSPNGERLASWARDGQTYLWDLTPANPTFKFLGSTTGGVAFSPNGRWIVSGAPNKLLQPWDARSGDRARELSATQ